MRPTADYPLDYAKGPAPSASDRPDAAGLRKTAEEVLNQAREYGAKAQDAIQNAKPFLERSAREQPMTTLAAMAAVGFVLGALWKK